MTVPFAPAMKLRHTILAGLLCSTGFGSAEAASSRSVTGVAPGHVAWIHRQPDPASPHVGYLKAGTLRVQTIACRKLAKGGWCEVQHRGTRGWVQDRFLKAGSVMRG